MQVLKESVKKAILDGAINEFFEHGYQSANMRRIADSANITVGNIYRYFENKDLLIRETYACLEEQILASVMAGYPGERPLRERFLHIWQRLATYYLASPLDFRFIAQFYNSPFGVACRRDRLHGRQEKDPITGLFEEGQEQQIIKELPLPALCALAYGPLVNLCRDHILQFIELDETLITRTAEACWDAVRR